MSATENAYSYVKSRILNRSYPEGAFLTEGEIAKALGVSRTPVREAFLLLKAEDLVQLVPKKGTLVPKISLREIKEVMEARILIESFAAEKLARKRGKIAPQLRTVLERQAEVAEDGKIEEFIRLDRQFHRMMVSSSSNKLLVAFYEGLRDRQIRMGIRAVAYSPERMKRVLEEHRAIVVAVEEADADELKKSIHEHLDATLAILEEEALE
jgi:DNA-binding GntR family transcriptional regulator